MLKVKIVCVGSLKEMFWRDAEAEFLKRLKKFCKVEIFEIKERSSFERARKIEAESKELLAKADGFKVLLDINGEELSSIEIANLIKALPNKTSVATFIIGGSDGIDASINKQVDRRISFGKITLPHNLARVVFLEQLYRAFMINGGHNYHK